MLNKLILLIVSLVNLRKAILWEINFGKSGKKKMAFQI